MIEEDFHVFCLFHIFHNDKKFCLQ